METEHISIPARGTQADHRVKYRLTSPEALSFDALPVRPATPSTWFLHRFPLHAHLGSPFLEAPYVDEHGIERVQVEGINEDFFAGILSGDSRFRHKVVFHESEQRFYFFETRDGFFYTTTDEKLKTLLSQLLLRCAQEMPPSVEIEPLFSAYRQERQLARIISKAKSILQAGHSFFDLDSPHKRKAGPEVHTRLARSFIRSEFQQVPGAYLKAKDCFALFQSFCAQHRFPPIDRKMFKSVMSEVIREEFDLGLRTDLQDEHKIWFHGWKGLRLKSVQLAILDINPAPQLLRATA